MGVILLGTPFNPEHTLQERRSFSLWVTFPTEALMSACGWVSQMSTVTCLSLLITTPAWPPWGHMGLALSSVYTQGQEGPLTLYLCLVVCFWECPELVIRAAELSLHLGGLSRSGSQTSFTNTLNTGVFSEGNTESRVEVNGKQEFNCETQSGIAETLF